MLTGFQKWDSFQRLAMEEMDHFTFPVGVAICDINGLSVINSTRGNQAGDQRINALAGIMRKNFPERTYYVRGIDAHLIALCSHSSEEEMAACVEKIKEQYDGSIQYAVGVAADEGQSIVATIIDAAKAMNYLASREGMLEKAYFVAIPTTSGTGSEVTTFAVISDPDKKAKYPLISENMLPDAAVLDAELTKTVPASITADTGIDVLTHAYEAYVSSKANDFTDAAAEKSMKLVFEYLPEAYKAAGKNIEELTKEDLYARQKMHHASCLAGMAFSNAGLGINHSMAHTLGGHFHIPHGRANAVLLPYVMAYNCGCRTSLTPAAERYAKMSTVLSLDSGSSRQSAFGAIRATKQLIRKLNIPSCIKNLGIPENEFVAALDEMVDAAMADSCTATNPRVPTREELKELFMEAYRGREI